ncbi:MAG: hypothetical protein A2X49_14515 [Lentisphaerae bacterium GWF2_52_8]|nr:MAG: hypothetical protein A2X49_14515 [Lentisphaerae bacterium GWF2_52_8]
MSEDGPGDIGVKGHCGPYQTFMFREAKKQLWNSISENSLEVTLTGWPYTANVWSPLGFGLTVRFTIREDVLKVELSPHNNEAYEASIIDSYYPRGFLFPEKSRGDLVLPYGQGCLLDKDSKLELNMVLPGYVGVAFVMPWWGQLCNDGAALIALANTPDDLGFRIHSDGGRKGASVNPYWQASLGGFKYKRVMNYKFFEKSSVMGLAKAYRRHAEEQGQAITLREKAAERPTVDSLIGGPHMHMWFMSTFSLFNHQSRVNYMRFSEGLRRYRKLCSLAGIGKKGLAHIDGWGRDGYDYNHPEVLPPDMRLGSWDGLRKLRDGIRKLGHTFLLHDNYVDYYKHTDAYKNDEGVMNMDGIKHESTEWLGGPQEWLCSTKAQKYMRKTFDGLAEKNCDVDGFYLDCWSIGHLRECYDPKHPATRTVTRKAWTEALALCHNRNYIVGSESGNDWAIPVMDYCHTVQPDVIPHILNGKVSSFGKAIPLYNMVWHDCLVCPGWINQDPKAQAVVKDGLVVPQLRDMRLWALLWGAPPALRTRSMDWGTFTEKQSEEDAAFIASLKPIWEFNGAVGYEPIVEWEMLSADSTSQKTVFGNGAEAEVDFDSGRYKLRNGKKKIEGSFDAKARAKK